MGDARGLRSALLVLCAAGCGTVHAPRGSVPLPAEAQRESFGGWAIVARSAADGRPLKVEGELLAVSSDSLWLLQDSGVLTIPAAEVQRAEVTGYNSQPGVVVAGTALGVLSTLSNGFYLVLTAPAWLLVGAAGSSGQAKVSRIAADKGHLPPLALYARFPQGIPDGLDRASLRTRSWPDRLRTGTVKPRALPAPSPAPQYYLSLGNSLAARPDPGPAGAPVRPDISYPAQLFQLMRAARPELQHVNLACGGETAAGMIHGGDCNPRLEGHARFAHGTQLAEAVAFLQSHRDSIAFVTIDIGGNDGSICHQRARGAECIGTVLENVRRIAAELRGAAGPATRIVGMNYYSPFLASWLTGEEGKRTAVQLTDSGMVRFNAGLAAAYASAGIPVADVAAAFSTSDYTLVRVAGLGEVPRNVQRICEWTSMCSAGDLHPNAEGYAVIARAFAAVLK